MNPVRLQRISYFLRNIKPIAKSLTYLIRLVFGCYLPYGLKLGKDFTVGYGGIGIVIHERTIIGDGVHIDQNVTIGGTSKKYGVPVLGNNVYVGAGAVILGPVKIGNEVVIGANAVVVKDVKEGSVVGGVPARVIKTNIKRTDYL